MRGKEQEDLILGGGVENDEEWVERSVLPTHEK
jgi:hypothetical protein